MMLVPGCLAVFLPQRLHQSTVLGRGVDGGTLTVRSRVQGGRRTQERAARPEGHHRLERRTQGRRRAGPRGAGEAAPHEARPWAATLPAARRSGTEAPAGRLLVHIRATARSCNLPLDR